MQRRLEQRADEIACAGFYLGHLEWVAWGCIHDRRVKLVLGSDVMDMYDWVCGYFAENGSSFDCPVPTDPAWVASVKWTGVPDEMLAVDRWASASNHFVLGRPLRLRHEALTDEPQWQPPCTSAKKAALRAGCVLLPTIAQGDCAPDCMAAHEGLMRGPAAWLAVRARLAAFLRAEAANPIWQQIALLCGESDEGHAPGQGVPGLGDDPAPRLGPVAPLAIPPKGGGLAALRLSDEALPVAGSAASSSIGVGSIVVKREPDRSPSPELQDEDQIVRRLPRPRSALCDAGDESGPALGEIVPAAYDHSKADEVRLVPLQPCAPILHVSGAARFQEWIRGLALEDLDNLSQRYESYKEAEMAMLRAAGVKKTPIEFQPRKHFTATRRAARLAMGSMFDQWLATAEGKLSKAKLRDFLQATHAEHRSFVPKAKKKWLADCAKAWRRQVKENGTLGASLPRGRKPTYAAGRCPDKLLCRRRGLQGRPFKSPEIRDLLWEWFVDMRASVAGIISPKMMMMKAKEFCERVLQKQRQSGCFAALPIINRHWLLRFKRDFGIVLRKPNARFKCSRVVLKHRLKCCQLNVFRVRRLAERLLGKDLADQIYGVDEKPLHFNESGSKAVATLEIAGTPAVALKQNHAATRNRVSLMTSVTSNAEVAKSCSNLPLELLNRARSAKLARTLRAPPGIRMSFAWSEKGSYRNEHILAYLAKWLAPWTEARARTNDWRILMLDVAKSHLGDEVVALAHSRGYVTLYHYGGTTGVAQVNDTHLHADFSRAYMNFEVMAFAAQQVHDPGDIGRTLQAVVDDVGAAWAACDHRVGVRGHWSNGLANALDGTEDWRISHVARTFWEESDMPAARSAALAEVDRLVDSGEISSFDEWQKLIKHPDDAGIRGEEGDGTEFEGDLEPGELPWATDAEQAKILDEERECLEADLQKRESREEVQVEPIRAGLACAARLARIQSLRGQIVDLALPDAVGIFDRHIKQAARALHAGGRPEAQQQTNEIRGLMDKVMNTLRASRQRKKQAMMRKRRLVARQRVQKKLAARREGIKQAARVEKKRMLETLPVRFDVDQLDARFKAGDKTREQCLERLKLRSPALSADHNAIWPEVRRHWCDKANYRLANKLTLYNHVGGHFLGQVNATLLSLGRYYDGPTLFTQPVKKSASKPGGEETPADPAAFQKLFDRMLAAYLKRRPKHGDILEM